MQYLIGIDSGLTVTKAALFQTDGVQVAVARRRVKQWQPREHFIERDMHELWGACCEAIKEVIDVSGINPANISGISQTAHGDGVYLLDKTNNPLGRGILSLDSRARSIVDEWQLDQTSKNSLAHCGQEPGVSSPAAILAWVKANEPDRYTSIGSIITCKDWIRYCLTDKVATDRTEASTAFTEVHSQQYSRKAFEIFGLEEVAHYMPETLQSVEVAGYVSHTAAAHTGLISGTPVATGLHDVCASALGMNAHRPNSLAIISGTYSINQVVSEKPVTNKNWFCRNAVETGLWNNMAISPASSANFDWYVTSMLEGGDQLHPKIAQQAEAMLRSCENPVMFHPFLFGSPYPKDASASLLGLRGWHGQKHISAAVLEGIIFNHCVHIEHLSEAFDFNSVSLTGGIARNTAVAQHFADALGQDVVVSNIDEAAAWGAAICAGIASGVFADLSDAEIKCSNNSSLYSPDINISDQVKHRFETYKQSVNNLSKVWQDLEGFGHVEPSS